MTQIPLNPPSAIPTIQTLTPTIKPTATDDVFDPTVDPVIPENVATYVPRKIPRSLQLFNLLGVILPALAVVAAGCALS
jgi:hypothetical protein